MQNCGKMLNPNRIDKPSNKRKQESAKSAAKILKSSNYKSVTQEELNQLQESTVDLSENVLTLQIANILKSFKVSVKYGNFIQKRITRFVTTRDWENATVG